MLKLVVATVLCGLFAASAVAAGAAPPVSPTLNPPPPPDYSCTATGSGTICRAQVVVPSYSEDTGIACGTGSDAFDIFDQGSYVENKTRYYDTNGNLTRRVINHHQTVGQWVNPATGAAVNYKQENVQTDVLAVPGDLTSSTQTITGEVIEKAANGANLGTGRPVFFATGRQVFNFDQSELISSTPHNGFIEAFFLGDPSQLDQVCAALS
jgi:hypothetical protein